VWDDVSGPSGDPSAEKSIGNRLSPHVTELPNGEIFVTWTSTGANLDEDIHGRLLTLDHSISGTPGNDVLHGSAGSDEIHGAAGKG
jgi:hypothetical protein